MNQPDRQDPSIPKAALATSLAIVAFFWLLATSPVLPINLIPVITLFLLNTFGAVILSFAGAAWWGMAATQPASAVRTVLFLLSAVPAIIGWIGANALMPADIGLLLIMAGFVLQWLCDALLLKHLSLPVWVFKLRTWSTAAILAALATAWWLLV